MKIIVAPDSYKGCMSASMVANAMEKGITDVFPHVDVVKIPIADGGEGTVDALVMAVGGKIIESTVRGPLGDPVLARWGIINEHTAVIEMAAASGLTLLPPDRRDPRKTSTYGTGQLIKAALDAGIRKIIIGIGGSATNDGGSGMARALGVKFLDHDGNEISEGGAALAHLARIDLTNLDARLTETEILVACDVDNPLCGPRGASAVYGPQKGATPEMVKELDNALRNYALVAQTATGRNVAECKGAGAAGGLGAGLLLFTHAQLKPGIQIVLDATNFHRHVQGADLVITGEGCTDYQTAHGKAPVGVASIAQNYKVPTVCLSGSLGERADDVTHCGIQCVMSVITKPMTLDDCMVQAPDLIRSAAARICRLVHVGMKMSLKHITKQSAN
jgi:glycerate kinase